MASNLTCGVVQKGKFLLLYFTIKGVSFCFRLARFTLRTIQYQRQTFQHRHLSLGGV